MQEAITEEAKKLAVQGEWFRLADKAKGDAQWGQVVRRMKEETQSWCVKAVLRILPDATNKRRWGWNTTDELKCKCGKLATEAHILNGCEMSLQRYKWRHDGVLRGLRDTFQKPAGESWHVFADVDNTAVEPHSQRWFAANGSAQLCGQTSCLSKKKMERSLRWSSSNCLVYGRPNRTKTSPLKKTSEP